VCGHVDLVPQSNGRRDMEGSLKQVWRRKYGPKREEIVDWKNYIPKNSSPSTDRIVK
jgi:hypothetical protein